MLLGVFLDRPLAAAAGMDLRLDHGDRAAQLGEGGGGFVGRAGDDAAGHGDAGLAEGFACLGYS